ncbi:DUF397 domain-containing protein [Streptomyces sp. ODS28]|uniref:DUF397 domain-containing protein n=1 Tax=Streptomyces sp. ODS28 TaxID=3136688 RepID=UPI0031E9B973
MNAEDTTHAHKLTWFKSSYSGPEGGDCVEAAFDWHKSTRSGSEGGQCLEASYAGWQKSSHSSGEGGECVEVAPRERLIHVRDSKKHAGAVLSFGAPQWGTFVEFVRQA